MLGTSNTISAVTFRKKKSELKNQLLLIADNNPEAV